MANEMSLEGDHRMNIGERIRTARESAGMTQTALAQAIGTRQQQIAKYEANQQEPTVSRLIAIAQALKIKPSQLLD